MHNYRAEVLCKAMTTGIAKMGETVSQTYSHPYPSGPEADVAVFYGMAGNLPQVFKDYRKRGKPCVCIDLGYWGRRGPSSKWGGYHKVAVNDRHPTAYFQKVKHDDTRFKVFGLTVQPWRQDRDKAKYVLIAGMGAKGSVFEGYTPGSWETEAVRQIREHTDRPIVYRPKPNWSDAPPIPGTKFSGKKESLVDVLKNCYAIVTHHSNVAVDGLIEGIPAFSWYGVATPKALSDLSKIEAPYYPEGREQWLADIAWTQWTPQEMESGDCWRYLKDEGLVP